MSDNIKFIKIPERQTISVNIRKDQVEFLKNLKKMNEISISRIVEQIIDNAYPNGTSGQGGWHG